MHRKAVIDMLLNHIENSRRCIALPWLDDDGLHMITRCSDPTYRNNAEKLGDAVLHFVSLIVTDLYPI
jgi:hypothetical protein